MDEVTLLNLARRGDLDSFNRLVLAYQDMVYSLTYRMMGEAEAADDATQETFISAYRHLKDFRGGSFKSWLLRIATNNCYDELRRRQRRPTTPLEPLDEDDQEIESASWMIDPGESPEAAVERRELNLALHHCLESLPAEFRSVVLLVDVQGLDYAEAAQVIQTPVGTVKSRLARARHRLRECLHEAKELFPTAFRLMEEGDA